MTTQFPDLSPLGVDGYLIRFADTLTEPANRAALALRGAVDAAQWDGVEETTTALASTYIRFDALRVEHGDIHARLSTLLQSRDWTNADLPDGRTLWRIPAAFGGDAGPQLEEAATLAGVSQQQAIDHFTSTRVRVQTLGFAPGMPYLGQLSQAWDIPRQKSLTKALPAGALAVAVRQFVLFPVSSTTGWRHIARTAFRPYQPESDTPFVLRPGDEVLFQAVDQDTLSAMYDDPHGGATSEVVS